MHAGFSTMRLIVVSLLLLYVVVSFFVFLSMMRPEQDRLGSIVVQRFGRKWTESIVSTSTGRPGSQELEIESVSEYGTTFWRVKWSESSDVVAVGYQGQGLVGSMRHLSGRMRGQGGIFVLEDVRWPGDKPGFRAFGVWRED